MSFAAVFLALQAAWMVPTPPPVTPTPAQARGAPSAIVDRTVEQPGERTRLSLFSNGVAVVSVRYRDATPVLFKRALPREELVGYLVALEDAARQIRSLDSIPDASGGRNGTVRIRLAAGPGDPIQLRFATLSMMPMAIGRLGAILDDLQTKVMATPKGYDELMGWVPREGDTVEMVTGQKADVIDVRKDGTIIVEYRDVGLTELVQKADRANRILRVLSRAKP